MKNILSRSMRSNFIYDIKDPLLGICELTKIMYSNEVDVGKKNNLSQIMLAANEVLNYLDELVVNDSMINYPVKADLVNLKNLVMDSINLLKPKITAKNLKIYHDYNDIPENIISDAIKIKIILMNLLTNAIKFTHSGKIWVSLNNIKFKGNFAFELIVEDTGIGIAKIHHKKIFDNGYQVDKNSEPCNVGSGLYFVNFLVKSLGGSITLQSEQGKGTLFVCLIPYEPVSYYKFKKSMHAMESMYKNKNLYRKKMESWRFLNKILAHKKFSWGSFRKFF